jgi:hypothetical protein
MPPARPVQRLLAQVAHDTEVADEALAEVLAKISRSDRPE